MSKERNFQRQAHDKYRTPYNGITSLLPFIRDVRKFIEPCAGDARLIGHLRRHGLECVQYFDLVPDDVFMPVADALYHPLQPCDAIITNPPWERLLLHLMIERFMKHAPTWLLFDAGWMYTAQGGTVARLLPHCSHVVVVGRLKWFDGSKFAGKEDCAWYRFDINHTSGPKIYPRGWK